MHYTSINESFTLFFEIFRNNKGLKFRDFRSDCVFTIDPKTARDLDDALSITLNDDGNYSVGVHIAGLLSKTIIDTTSKIYFLIIDPTPLIYKFEKTTSQGSTTLRSS